MAPASHSIVLLVIALRCAILLVLDLRAFGGGEASPIVFAHVALFGAGFFSLQPDGFARRPLTVLHTIGDMFLRMLLALLDCRLVFGRCHPGGSAGCLRGNRYGERAQAGGQEQILQRRFHKSMLGQAMGGGNAYP